MELQKTPRFNNSHSQSLHLTTEKYPFSSVLRTSLKSITDRLFWHIVELHISQPKWQPCKCAEIHSILHPLPVQPRAAPAMLDSSSSIKNGCATALLQNCQYHLRHHSEGTARETNGTGSLSPGEGKAASTAWLLGKAINSRCQLALKNNFCFSLMLHLPPKCSQC